MEYVDRDRVPLLTGMLTIVSLALVFAAAGGVVPQDAVPAPPEWVLEAIPHLNAVISLAAIGTIGLGWRAIRRGDVRRHQLAMGVSLLLFVAFLFFYLYRLVVVGGAATFPGPDPVYQFVYLPVLGIHMLLAIVCIPLLYYVLLLALSRPISELRETSHATVGRVAASLWIVSFALGVVVYVMLYWLY
ncbi:DUF420 domain-containing protein [Natrialbaceae archaeon AArc-T1-2]|uniref:DUF420 domain-containing protein n=1 Tax=Natrialbaceae archaeon AArc-T1-2 TaxID=3053904 RepID=UPI00255B0813|nr:DUF420 domain-containing protein [Natrialbaceae archaeon AArc-T1-2]WIV66792.1 DUF420 domain-containing protein [Natrialbaceae archaeon AArc-T1-2]